MKQIMKEIITEVKNLTKVYGKITALKNVNLRVRRGEILGLVGDNGSGKSTFLKLLRRTDLPHGRGGKPVRRLRGAGAGVAEETRRHHDRGAGILSATHRGGKPGILPNPERNTGKGAGRDVLKQIGPV